MSETTTNAVEAVTASQRRHLFQEMIGATPEKNHNLWWALDQTIVAALDQRDEETDQQVAELCRHFPGLEQVMLIIWHEHIQRGEVDSCCGCEPAVAVTDDAS